MMSLLQNAVTTLEGITPLLMGSVANWQTFLDVQLFFESV